jgi:hypothetical protein
VSREASTLRGRRPPGRQRGAPPHHELHPLDLPSRLREALLELAATDRVLERCHDLPQPGELVAKELLIPLGGVRLSGSESAQIGLAIEGVLDGVSGRIILSGQAGAPPLDGRREERQPPPMMDAQLL